MDLDRVNYQLLKLYIMKRYNEFSIKTLILTITALLFTAVSCTNPVGSDEHDDHDHNEHEEPVGVILNMNGVEIARYDANGISGAIEVNSGEETTLITAWFMAEDGDLFQPGEPEYSLSWKDVDTSIATVEQHDEDGKWSFHVRGEAQGSTSVVVQLFHEGHSDFDTQPIPITVN